MRSNPASLINDMLSAGRSEEDIRRSAQDIEEGRLTDAGELLRELDA